MNQNNSFPQSNKRVNGAWEPESISDDQRIWRYMDIDKFLHLVQSNTLYMSPMAQFLDTYEGTFTRKTIEMFHQHMSSSGVSTAQAQNQKHVDEIFVGCWHINDRESMTMWNAYTTSRFSIVIESTVKQLKGALDNGLSAVANPINETLAECGIPSNTHTSDRYHIKIGRVNYIDETYPMYSFNAYETIFSKRKPYTFENELRAVIHRKISSNVIAGGVKTGDKLPNWDISVSDLLNFVRIHPEGSTIFESQVRSVLDNLNIIVPVGSSLIK